MSDPTVRRAEIRWEEDWEEEDWESDTPAGRWVAQDGEDAKPCEHVVSFVAYCNATGVRPSGCGECGTPWVVCDTCAVLILNAAHLFPERQP